MNIIDQVCSLELAKKLKELGVKQDSLFYYGHNVALKENGIYYVYNNDDGLWIQEYSAFTVAELGEMLPHFIDINFMFMQCKISNDGEKYLCFYQDATTNKMSWMTARQVKSDKKEADSRAKMLIYLIENKMVNINDI